ncbi:hypothetical protein, partial [Cecembia rubra]|uniref:hypothetical protein n=1 Tax=Cecembia rubra TaxID=1485585 RepID=UPI002714B052
SKNKVYLRIGSRFFISIHRIGSIAPKWFKSSDLDHRTAVFRLQFPKSAAFYPSVWQVCSSA